MKKRDRVLDALPQNVGYFVKESMRRYKGGYWKVDDDG